MRSWRVIPMREYPNLCVIKEEDGNIIATVQTEYAEKIESLPELIAAGRQLFEDLKGQYKRWSEESSLGRFEKVIARFQDVK